MVLKGKHQQLGLVKQLDLWKVLFGSFINEQNWLNQPFNKVLEDFEPATVDFSDMGVIVSGPSWLFIAQICVVVKAEVANQPLKLVGLVARRLSDLVKLIEIESGWDGRDQLELLIYSLLMTPFILVIQVPCQIDSENSGGLVIEVKSGREVFEFADGALS
jgi:hypothetical protein